MTSHLLAFSLIASLLACPPLLRAQDSVHGLSLYQGSLKYPPNFPHLAYVNPKAPKGGEVTLPAVGTYDTLNPFSIKATPVEGVSPLHPSLLHATLMTRVGDEASSVYAYVAESAERSSDGYSIIFTLCEQATFHDGSPITPEDVVFSFNLLKEKGQPFYKAYYKDISSAEKVGQRRVKFTFSNNKNHELPLIITEFPILSKAYYSTHDITKASLDIPLGSGPYRIERVEAGRSVTYLRVKGWWGEQIPVMRGRYNFERIHYIYFLDPQVAFEAFKAGTYDLRFENIAKNWATAYTFPAVKRGDVQRLAISHQLPQGMKGFVFNLRRPIFQDRKVRRALSLLFDFEWLNKHYFHSLYTRCNSYFGNSELAARGLPSEGELKILEPFRSQLPAEVFAEAFQMPVNDGSGNIRPLIRKADQLLKEAGWIVKDQKRVHQATGQPLKFEILLPDPTLVRTCKTYVSHLESLGVQVSLKIVDSAQYERRVESFDFDLANAVFPQSESPGNEQNDFWGSQSADAKGSRNLAGIKEPVIDALIQRLVDATTREDLITCVRALDRVLLWNYYVIPHWYSEKIYLAFWSKLKRPLTSPSHFGIDPYAWWVDLDREKQLKIRQ